MNKPFNVGFKLDYCSNPLRKTKREEREALYKLWLISQGRDVEATIANQKEFISK